MDSIISYFHGEKLQCGIGAILSVFFITVSIILLFQQKAFCKGLAFTIIPFSMLLLFICIGVIVRTSKDIERMTTFYKEKPMSIQSEEIPRMEKVIKNFTIIKNVELVILIIGFAMTFLYWSNELIRGVAVGLLIMGISLYTFDYIAESRGKAYIQFLKTM